MPVHVRGRAPGRLWPALPAAPCAAAPLQGVLVPGGALAVLTVCILILLCTAASLELQRVTNGGVKTTPLPSMPRP